MHWSLSFAVFFSLCISSFAAPSSSTSSSNPTAGPPACVAFDSNWNLLAFGFNGKDYNAGAQDTWASGTPTDITKSGRPPFNSPNTTCYLAQFYNAIYVINADKANPSNLYIYDATAGSWSTQKTTPGHFDHSNFAAILDHDTNIFYAYSNAELYSLDMSSLKAAQSSAIPWTDVQSPDLSAHATNQAAQVPGANTAGYQPVMALAKNHIHFLGVPGLNKGTVKIFVIHFSFMQPTPQAYSPASFPTMHGKAVSIFQPQGRGVQTEFAFVPDDFSATFIINVVSNTTKTLTAPPKVDPGACFAASTNSIVMLGNDGVVRSLAYDPNTTESGGTWTTVSKLPTVDFTSSLLPVSNGANSTNSTGSSLGSAESSNSRSSSSQTGGAPASMNPMWAILVGSTLFLIGFAL
jgi:hypothetical protein